MHDAHRNGCALEALVLSTASPSSSMECMPQMRIEDTVGCMSIEDRLGSMRIEARVHRRGPTCRGMQHGVLHSGVLHGVLSRSNRARCLLSAVVNHVNILVCVHGNARQEACVALSHKGRASMHRFDAPLGCI